MKKLLLILLAVLCLTGCGEITKDTAIKKLDKKINSKSYTLDGTMEIISNEETFNYSLNVYSYDKKYYKVALINQMNNHEQVILKNDDGVYVVTPALNKSFKFQSEWPNNSSQAYILESILKDIKSDKDSKFEKTENEYTLKSEVNYPNNSDLLYQVVVFDDDMNIKEIKVYDTNNIAKIIVTINNINYKAKLEKNDFLLDDLIKKDSHSNNICEPKNEENYCDNNKSEVKSEQVPQEGSNDETEQKTNNIIENIIYPLYIPNNTYLSDSEKIDIDNGNRVILTFSGEKEFVLVEETSKASNEFEIIPIYGDPQVMSTSVAALGANSIYFTIDNIDYYLASNEMSSEEMLTVAASLGNSVLTMESK